MAGVDQRRKRAGVGPGNSAPKHLDTEVSAVQFARC